jgi:type IV pilus assembly protein PilA
MKTMMNETPNEIINTNPRGNNKMKKFTKILKNEKGLTLIELLAVIVILAIVAAIAVPAIGGIIDSSREKAILADTSAILSGAKLAVTSGSCTENTTTAGNYTCNETQLTPFVEGIKADSDFSASKAGNVWSVSFSELKATANWKIDPQPVVTGAALTSTATITEDALLNALGK